MLGLAAYNKIQSNSDLNKIVYFSSEIWRSSKAGVAQGPRFFLFYPPGCGFHSQGHSWSKVTARAPTIVPIFQAGGRIGVRLREHTSLFSQPSLRSSFGSSTKHLKSFQLERGYVTIVSSRKAGNLGVLVEWFATPNTIGILFRRNTGNGCYIGR